MYFKYILQEDLGKLSTSNDNLSEGNTKVNWGACVILSYERKLFSSLCDVNECRMFYFFKKRRKKGDLAEFLGGLPKQLNIR